jgi:hypothetical protein
MQDGLFEQVQTALETRKGEWRRIADELAPDVSFSMIDKIGRGKYDSSPTVGKLEKIATWLRENPAEQAAA